MRRCVAACCGFQSSYQSKSISHRLNLETFSWHSVALPELRYVSQTSKIHLTLMQKHSGSVMYWASRFSK